MSLPYHEQETKQDEATSFCSLGNIQFRGPSNALKQGIWQHRKLCNFSVLEPKLQEIQ
jgi:hypothetical protein